MYDDTADEKWRMKGQTKMKHRILEAYLKVWSMKISEIGDEIVYVDGFAGKGEYGDDSYGSPILALRAARDVSDILEDKINRFQCHFVEKEGENLENLEELVRQEEGSIPDYIQFKTYNEEFEDFATKFIQKHRANAPPSFIFIDPFGFNGLPFDIVEKLINLRRNGVELFITFMSGKMAQFMGSQNHAKAIDQILGTESWRDQVKEDMDKEERANEFMRIYEQQLSERAGVNFVWPFKMMEESKGQTSYYLIHATNHFEGFRIMKKNMFSKGAGQEFAYLGPEHYRYQDAQTGLSNFGVDVDNTTQELAEHLEQRFKDKELKFIDILERVLPSTPYIDKHVRKSCKYLAENSRARIINQPEMPDGTERGLQDDDIVRFVDERLQNWM